MNIKFDIFHDMLLPQHKAKWITFQQLETSERKMQEHEKRWTAENEEELGWEGSRSTLAFSGLKPTEIFINGKIIN